MTVTLELNDEELHSLEARARAEGLSIEEWLRKLAHESAQETAAPPARTLHEFLARSPLRGSGLDLERQPDVARPIDLG